MFNLDALTWTCMVCGDERPDRFISVAYARLRGLEAKYPDVKVNIRFCNDRTTCSATALAADYWPPVVDPDTCPHPVTVNKFDGSTMCEDCGTIVWRGRA